jgi:hypothetical protein
MYESMRRALIWAIIGAIVISPGIVALAMLATGNAGG